VYTCALDVQHCDTLGVSMRTLGCVGAHRPYIIATPSVCRCAPAVHHCCTLGVFVRTGRAALLHTRCARLQL